MEGLYIPAVTPFDREEISFEKIKNNVSKWNKTDISGYLVLGSTGEFPHLNVQEKIRVISAFKEMVEDKELIVQSGMPSLRETIKLSNVAMELGADKVLILSNFYYKNRIPKEAIIDFYSSAADKIELPVMIYNMPGFTGVNLPSDVVIELSGHDNIVGIKDSSGNLKQLEEIIKGKKKADFFVFSGSAPNFYTSLKLGADGGIYALANIVPTIFTRIFKEFRKNNFETADRLQNSILKLSEALQKHYSINGIKAAMDMVGFSGGSARKPLIALNRNELEDLREIMAQIKAELQYT